MPREDLLTLSLDDLAALSNRGTVKRAQKELAAGKIGVDLSESADGAVEASWSDGTTCSIPAHAALTEARCSSTLYGISRYLIMTVLAYQAHNAEHADDDGTARKSWDPGAVDDDVLGTYYSPRQWRQLQQRFAQGVVVELLRSAKPLAKFESETCHIRFAVPGDMRYAFCTCGAGRPCPGVALAVWSFRELASDQAAGLVATIKNEPIPDTVFVAAENLLGECLQSGIEKLPRLWQDRVTRECERLREADLIWPASLLSDMVLQQRRYLRHDALFDPLRLGRAIGEFLIRADVLRGTGSSVPQLFVKGSARKQTGEYRNARLIGLGSVLTETAQSVEMAALMVDGDNGAVSVYPRVFAQTDDDSRRPFSRLAQTSITRNISLHGLACGRVLMKKGYRSLRQELSFSRSPMTLQPQSYRWEKLPPQILVDDFAELRQRLGQRIPASLRPRLLADTVQVLMVKEVRAVDFIEHLQIISIAVADAQGETVSVLHPYHALAASGYDKLIGLLNDPSNALRFVSGQVYKTAADLCMRPACLVFEDAAGGRTAAVPWTDAAGDTAAETRKDSQALTVAAPVLRTALTEFAELLAETVLKGVEWLGPDELGAWREQERQLQESGFIRIGAAVCAFNQALAQKQERSRWNPAKAVKQLLFLIVLERLLQDIEVDS